MTKIQTLLKEIETLNFNDLELLLKEILQKMDRVEKAQSALDNFIGVGKGVWNLDAQDYVYSLRQEDRH